VSIKQKLLNAISAHPKLAAFAIGLAITMAVGTAIGMLDVHPAAALGGNNIQGGKVGLFLSSSTHQQHLSNNIQGGKVGIF
jgi:hypothetical protein